MGAGVHQFRRAAQRLLLRFMVAAEGQIADHPGRGLHTLQASHHTFGVVAHGFQRDAYRAGQALADHAQRIAHQDAFHARGIGHGGEGGVVGGEHGDLLAALTHFLQARQAHRFALGHGRGRRQGAVGCAAGRGGGFR